MYCQGEQHWQHLLDKMNTLESAEQYYTGSPVLRVLRRRRSLYSDATFRREVWGVLQDGAPVVDPPFLVPCIVGAVNENGAYEVFTDADEPDVLRGGMMGSSKVSPFYPPEQIGDDLYIDGGYRHFLGDLINVGADRIVIISTEPLSEKEGRLAPVKEGVLPALDHALRGISIMHREIVQGDIDTFDAINDLIPEGETKRVGRSGRIYHRVESVKVYPKHSRSGMVTSPSLVKEDFQEGFARMNDAIKQTDWLSSTHD